MFIVLHTEIVDLPVGFTADSLLDVLPDALRKSIKHYKNEHDRLVRVAGKLLLLEAHGAIGYGKELILSDLCYSSENKPFIPGGLHFSIAHAFPCVVCVLSKSASVGIDVEVPTLLDVEAFAADYLTEREVCALNESPNLTECFLRFWVRKEAVLKCAGTALGHDMPDVLECPTTFMGQQFFFKDFLFASNAFCSIASSEPLKNMSVKSVDFTDMIKRHLV